ncbi:hypothetical protein J5N97_022448 [Dioscorea zingiberensis]|uniref:Uncharacterized protein n=1 Tax=Dioscorea zingiberensis TaxID=325984 RepID=A0A9D5HAJ7_9LILI|nr:hypothetical protein J5N97_022448 [Dioscorea zingiberensis]
MCKRLQLESGYGGGPSGEGPDGSDLPMYEKDGKPSELADIDIFVSTVDPLKEPPLITANTVLSILAVDYPVNKVSCYVSDDGAAMLTFEALSETSVFAKKWVPFCKKFNIEPRAPMDDEGCVLPRLIYVSREKRPGFNHHKKAGAMNALVRVSAVISNAPYILNVDCDHYINNSKALREAMCFMMDPISGKKKFVMYSFLRDSDGIDHMTDIQNRMSINMKGLDGIQGPIYVGTGCVFRRQALYGDLRLRRYQVVPRQNLRRNLDNPRICCFTLQENGGHGQGVSFAFVWVKLCMSLAVAMKIKLEWGKEVGWIYGSVTEDILTGFKMHCHGWRSVYCIPRRPAFKGSAPINLSDRGSHPSFTLGPFGSVEIFLSKHCPIWYGYGGGLKWLERFSLHKFSRLSLDIHSIDRTALLPAICLLTGKFIIPEISSYASIVFMALFISIAATGVLEMQWGHVGIDDWWRNEQFWVIGGVSSHFFALLQGLLKVFVVL